MKKNKSPPSARSILKTNEMKNDCNMKLKPLPQNIVVHTPTEAEAKELLAILHENGYKWGYCSESLINLSHWEQYKTAMGYFIDANDDIIQYGDMDDRDNLDGYSILTLSEFKEKYCESEKPQSKFKKGDIVRVIEPNCWHSGQVGIVRKERTSSNQVIVGFSESGGDNFYSEEYLEPYTEPETKPTDDMETKDETKDETKELNLCELLKGHEGEKFYSLSLGEVTLKKIENNIVLCFINEDMDEPMYVRFDGTARYGIGGVCLIFPSRALYEQYPLDPYTAWMKWQEEQADLLCDFSIDSTNKGWAYRAIFRTPADFDKCIEEITEIIEKYSK